MLKSFKLLFLGVFIAIGLATFAYSIWSLIGAYQSTKWPSVVGQMLEANCVSGAKSSTSSRLVKYSYTVSTIAYVGDREYFGIRISSTDCSVGYAEKQQITVFYNPNDPMASVLQPGSYRAAQFGLFVGAMFSLFGIVGHFLVNKEKT